MGHKSYQSIYYHIVFRTKNRQPYLHSDTRKEVYQYIWEQCKLRSYNLYRIGGNDWHVHLLISIPPKIPVSEAVNRLKGASSHFFNQVSPSSNTLYWQRGYGVVTVSKADLGKISDYIKNQDQHHSTDNLIEEYETVEVDETT